MSDQAEPSFQCPRCGKASSHPADIAQGYCGNCHDWTGRRRPVHASALLDDYLRRLAIGVPADAGEQIAIHMLRDMLERLEVILADKRVDPAAAHEILRELIIGALPHRAETEMRLMAVDMAAGYAARAAVPGFSAQPGHGGGGRSG